MNPNKSRKRQRSQSYQSFSVMAFRDAAVQNMREIGRNLGVANILEGSVRKECAKPPLLSLANSKTRHKFGYGQDHLAEQANTRADISSWSP